MYFYTLPFYHLSGAIKEEVKNSSNVNVVIVVV